MAAFRLKSIFDNLSNTPKIWALNIKMFEVLDKITPPSKDIIVFTGSSSITFWYSLEKDMAPLPVINRGFGGSRINDVVYYADQIVTPYHPRAVVLFAGTNDIAGPKPKSAQDVYQGFLAFRKAVHSQLPQVPIYYVSITPTPSRWELWHIAEKANSLIKAYCETDKYLHFFELSSQFLSPEGTPDRSLYKMDRLHPNKKGYAIWTSVIKPILTTDLQLTDIPL
jgi:lysophospholipase L1-like esterase